MSSKKETGSVDAGYVQNIAVLSHVAAPNQDLLIPSAESVPLSFPAAFASVDLYNFAPQNISSPVEIYQKNLHFEDSDFVKEKNGYKYDPILKRNDESSSAGTDVFSEETANNTTSSVDVIQNEEVTVLDPFLINTLQNSKDRLFLLQIERDMENFIIDLNAPKRLEYPMMNSYQRLIIHRVAQHYKLAHVVEAQRKAVIIYKAPDAEIPLQRLQDITLPEQQTQPHEKQYLPSVKIMQRRTKQHRQSNHHQSNNNGLQIQSKSIEEREAAYQLARAQIFQEDSSEGSKDHDVKQKAFQSSKSRSIPNNNPPTVRPRYSSPYPYPYPGQFPGQYSGQQYGFRPPPGMVYPSSFYPNGFQPYPPMAMPYFHQPGEPHYEYPTDWTRPQPVNESGANEEINPQYQYSYSQYAPPPNVQDAQFAGKMFPHPNAIPYPYSMIPYPVQGFEVQPQHLTIIQQQQQNSDGEFSQNHTEGPCSDQDSSKQIAEVTQEDHKFIESSGVGPPPLRPSFGNPHQPTPHYHPNVPPTQNFKAFQNTPPEAASTTTEEISNALRTLDINN
ncbi:R3H domain-containing protein 1 [Nowakowskiella sp. JEL0078]|nr:R3H domain-containing protein 1 [Nowakowskiella sp. JEL0078]